MVTFKPVVAAHQRKADGTYNVKIRVTYKRVSRWIPTTISCTQADLTRTLHIKSAGLQNRCDALVAKMRDAVAQLSPFALEGRDVDFVVRWIRDSLGGQEWRLDFFQWGDKVVSTKSEPTRRAYRTALNNFARFLGKRELDINDITKSMLLDFMEYMERTPKAAYINEDGSVKEGARSKLPHLSASVNMMKLSHIYNAAKMRYNDDDTGKVLIPRSPFSRIKLTFPAPTRGQHNLGVELMQRIILSDAQDRAERIGLDAFIVSFGLMGANLADLYECKRFDGALWVYNRRKTKTRRADRAEMRVRVPACLGPYIGRLRQGEGVWWLTALHSWRGGQITQAVNSQLARWCKRKGVPEFTFYAARKSWASIARAKAGVDKATIDECLNHTGDLHMADIYIEKDWGIINDANAKVLSLFEWGEG